MSAHTPGPWRHYDDEIVQNINGSLGDPTVCSLVSAGGDAFADDEDEFMANARLIAAAPDLLEALQAIIGHDAHLLNRYRVEAARAAIAKATKP